MPEKRELTTPQQQSQFEQQAATLLQQCGLSEAEAREEAQAMSMRLSTAAAGTSFSIKDPSEIGQLWRRAARSGARSITVKIGYDAQDADEAYHITASVLDREDFQ